jgi:hypothetical protein
MDTEDLERSISDWTEGDFEWEEEANWESSDWVRLCSLLENEDVLKAANWAFEMRGFTGDAFWTDRMESRLVDSMEVVSSAEVTLVVTGG